MKVMLFSGVFSYDFTVDVQRQQNVCVRWRRVLIMTWRADARIFA